MIHNIRSPRITLLLRNVDPQTKHSRIEMNSRDSMRRSDFRKGMLHDHSLVVLFRLREAPSGEG